MDERTNRIRPAGPLAADRRARMEAAFLQEGFDELVRWVREAGRALVAGEGGGTPADAEITSPGEVLLPAAPVEVAGGPGLDAETRARLVAEAGVFGTWSFDADSGVISADSSVPPLFGLAPAGSWSLDAYVARVVPADRMRFLDTIRGALRGEGGHVEVRAVDATNAARWIAVRASARCALPGRGSDLVGTMTDVTERNQREAELRLANRRKDEFLAMLAHELRNPMAAIGTALALMERSDGDPERTAKHRETARRQMKNVVRLVDDLLDISRVARGKVTLRREETDFATIVQCALTATRALLEARRHELTVTVSPGGFRMVADGTRLEQVVVNLLTNAAKYTDPGGRISVHLRNDQEDGAGLAVLRVRDTGRGIPRAMLDRVFEPFVQLGPQADHATGNLGVGLALVKGLVTMHGGSVTAHSDGLGKGSEFVIRLPLQAEAEVAPTVPESDAPATTFRRRRILIVDDAEGVRETLKDLLEELGHEVFVAADGLEGVMQLKAVRPDVVLVDVGLPRIDGYAFARRVRALRGGDRTTLIALTGYGGAGAKARARQAGFDLHLAKPVDLDALPGILLSTGRLDSSGR